MINDGINLLIEDHRRVEALYAQAQEAGGDRRAIADQIVRELSVHDAIEKQHLYPKVRDQVPGGAAMAERSLGEHQKVEDLLAAVERAGDDAEAAGRALRETMVNVADHVAEEEAQIFPALRAVLRPQELENLASDLEAARKVAPTHPHPSSPDHGLGARVAGTAAGLVDRAKDTVAGRPSDRDQTAP